MNKPLISVIVCTYNRAAYLRKALRSLCGQAFPKDAFEVLVVDNNSTDDTARLVREEFAGEENVRYIFEPVQGLSQARNTGWRNARGEYVAYLDDDAVASERWLAEIQVAFGTTIPQPAVVGGEIDLAWEAPRPPWLIDAWLVYLGKFDLAPASRWLGSEEWVGGGNCAFKRDVLAQIGGFDTQVGRKGDSLISNDEVLLFRKLQESGRRLYYRPAMKIWHSVPEERLTLPWFERRFFWQGVSDVTTERLLQEGPVCNEWRRLVRTMISLASRPHLLLAQAIPSVNVRVVQARMEGRYRFGVLSALWKGLTGKR